MLRANNLSGFVAHDLSGLIGHRGVTLRPTRLLQEIRKTRFEQAYQGWQVRRLTQEAAARLLGVSERTFRRHIERYEAAGLLGLIDKRLEQVSHRRAPVDEVMALTELYLIVEAQGQPA